jgi:Permuted papain-like amidase enzyme, YaeF/YiiX, C92 family
MKKIFFIMAVFFCIMLLAYRAFFYFDHLSEQAAVIAHRTMARLSPQDYLKLREGDFILRRGFGLFSDAIANNLNNGAATDVTHAGIIVRQNGTWQVIHSLSSDVTHIDGVQLQPLDTFLNYSAPGKIIITRAKNADAALGKKIAAQAAFYLKKQVPFDHQGVIDDKSKLFCTEMIWLILEKDLKHISLPPDYDTRKKLFYSMAPMYDTTYFDIVLNQYAVAPAN